MVGAMASVCEDEPLISIMIEEIAVDLGWKVEGCAYTESDAFILLEACRPSVALLDINLGPNTSLGVAASCRDRGIPVVFVTGYTVREIPKECGDAPILAKPFSTDDLGGALHRGLTMEQRNGRQSLQRNNRKTVQSAH